MKLKTGLHHPLPFGLHHPFYLYGLHHPFYLLAYITLLTFWLTSPFTFMAYIILLHLYVFAYITFCSSFSFKLSTSLSSLPRTFSAFFHFAHPSPWHPLISRGPSPLLQTSTPRYLHHPLFLSFLRNFALHYSLTTLSSASPQRIFHSHSVPALLSCLSTVHPPFSSALTLPSSSVLSTQPHHH